MPLFYQHNINEFSKLGIWKIEEEEEFFSSKVPLQREISHPHKRLQHLAGRYLLQYLFPGFPIELIMIADTRKPFLSNEAFHFSISHCGDFAAAIVSGHNRVGVDIELVKPVIQKIRRKFLSEDEMMLLPDGNDPAILIPASVEEHVLQTPSTYFLTLCWSAKEAMYKWYGDGGVDFRAHMKLQRPINLNNNSFIESHYTFSKKEQVSLYVMSKKFDDLVMSYVIS